ncbi:hypothetical protein HanIR_Chr14g0700141 [Helianthus annuus]|nr:hypothetical protein HanIR_Chr14g0700141 [Helianthus annuus]
MNTDLHKLNVMLHTCNKKLTTHDAFIKNSHTCTDISPGEPIYQQYIGHISASAILTA